MPTSPRKATPRTRTGTPHGGHGFVDAGEEEGPSDRDDGHADAETDPGSDGCLIGAEPEDGAEEDVDAGGPVAGALVRGEDAEEQDAEAEDPGEDDADDDVVGAAVFAEEADREADGDGGEEETEAGIDAECEGGECAGERDVAECITAEDLAAKHDEVADQAAGGGDGGAGEEGVADEGVREHVEDAVAGGVAEQGHRDARRVRAVAMVQRPTFAAT